MKDALFGPIEAEARRAITASVPDQKFHFDWALRLFALASVARDNEYCYRLIFGSQIKALKQSCSIRRSYLGREAQGDL